MYAVPGNTAVVFCNTVHWYVNPVPPPLLTVILGLTFSGVHPSLAEMLISGGAATVIIVCDVAVPHKLFTVRRTT